VSISSQQLAEIEARLAKGRQKHDCRSTDAPPARFDGKEADLHRLIIERLKSNRWLFHHSRCDRATTNVVGEPDFSIFSGNGAVLFIEVKVGNNKLSPEQRAWQYCCQVLGYKYVVIRSFEEFLKTIESL
jgi:hypothetical protein